MKRVNPKLAKGAAPAEISRRILEALLDATESQAAEATFTFKGDLNGTGSTWCPETGVRIDYFGSNVFVEEPQGRPFDATFSLQNVFRFLLMALAEQAENEARDAQQEADVAEAKRVKDYMAHATEETVEFVPLGPSTPVKDSSDAG